MSGIKEIGLFIGRRGCVSYGRFCKVKPVKDDPTYIESACCGALLRFAK